MVEFLAVALLPELNVLVLGLLASKSVSVRAKVRQQLSAYHGGWCARGACAEDEHKA